MKARLDLLGFQAKALVVLDAQQKQLVCLCQEKYFEFQIDIWGMRNDHLAIAEAFEWFMSYIEAFGVQEVHASSFLCEHDAFDSFVGFVVWDDLKIDESNTVLNEDGFQVLLDVQRQSQNFNMTK